MDSQQDALGALDQYKLDCVEDTCSVIKRTTYTSLCEVNYCGITCLATKYNISELEQSQLDKKQIQECVASQVELLGRLRHPNIAQFLGIYYETAESESIVPTIVHELLPATLGECLSKYRALPHRTNLSILRDVALALRYLHEQSPPISHGSISVSVVFLSPNLTAKLGGVGDHLVFSEQDTSLGTVSCTVAPELILRGRICMEPTTSSDMFSFGALVNTLLKLFTEDDSSKNEPLLKSSKKHYLSDITKQCLCADSSHRPAAKSVLVSIEKALSALPGEASTPLEVLLKRKRHLESFSFVSQDSAVSSESIGGQENSQHSQVKQEDIYISDQISTVMSNVARPLEEELCKRKTEIRYKSRLRRQSTISELQEGSLQWTKCADIPVGMFQAQGTLINNRVYVGGGNTDMDDANCNVYEYDPAADSWRTLPPASLSCFGLGQLEGELVIVGGRYGSEVSDTAFVFDRFSQRWKTSLPPLFTPRYSPTCLSQAKTLTVSGGLTQSGQIVSSIEVITSDDFQWQVVGYLSRSALLCYPSPVVLKDSFYLLGGYTAPTACSVTNSAHFASLEVLVSSKILNPYIWHSLPDTPHSQTTAACLNGYLLALGGSTFPYSKPLHRSVHAYCPYIDSWECIGALPHESCHSTAVSLGQDEFLLIGGWVQPGKFKRSNAVYRCKFVTNAVVN